MTDLTFVRSTHMSRAISWRVPWIATLYTAGAVAGGAGLAAASVAHPAAQFEWQLTLLLRFMAVVKAVMVLGAFGLTHWRLRQPIGGRLSAAYIMSLSLMLVAPGLIWSLQHIALGAALFHAGFFAFLLLAWRDDAAGKLLPHWRASSVARP